MLGFVLHKLPGKKYYYGAQKQKHLQDRYLLTKFITHDSLYWKKIE